jgi:DNA invertase Pin-like site-specific DNA recombinase
LCYLCVSTERQSQSGLGLEAQRAAVAAHVLGWGEVVAEFVEVESGKRADRPQLARALAEANRAEAVLLLESGVEVTAADMPEANRFVLHIMAAVAEQEGRAISERTKVALAAAKARGVKLG